MTGASVTGASVTGASVTGASVTIASVGKNSALSYTGAGLDCALSHAALSSSVSASRYSVII
ncbi:MAG: hypothetical protein J6Y48_05715 [Clostridia bacterium]|nr:hypothetical protein [Clostridia bacterium]